MAKRALKAEVEPKPKRKRKRKNENVFTLRMHEGRLEWHSFQQGVNVVIPFHATTHAIEQIIGVGKAPNSAIRLIFEPWED